MKTRPISQEWMETAKQLFYDNTSPKSHNMTQTSWFRIYVSRYWDEGMSAEIAGKEAAKSYNAEIAVYGYKFDT